VRPSHLGGPSTNLRRERQLEGIARAKAEGVYKGRPASIDGVKVRAMKAKGMGATEIARALKIGRASVYRALEGAALVDAATWEPKVTVRRLVTKVVLWPV
jgi:DNA invertase Pin-like site-specific DNA recombinase